MLVLTRKLGESVVLDDQIVLTVSQISGQRIKICVEAPRHRIVSRSELVQNGNTEVAAKQAAANR